MGRGGKSLAEDENWSRKALDMALGRGGDQVVVKNKFNFEFYGGRTKELEKRTKVRAGHGNALGELMADASRVFVMGHKYPDMDCIGAAAGVCAMARKKGAPVHIIKEAGQNPASEMSERLGGLGEYKDVFLSQQDAILLADANCLLVVVDTNRPEQVVSQDLLEAVHKVAVIDHHRRASSYIADAALNFHEPYASSASELVTELLQYLLEPADLLKTEAEALLAGMVLDTKQFTMRTGSRTFEAAAFLRRSGADTGDVKKLLLQLMIPAVVAQVVNLLYNIVDRIYIGHIPEVGDLALTGVGVTFPIITLVSAFAAFAGQGGAPLAAIQLGAGKKGPGGADPGQLSGPSADDRRSADGGLQRLQGAHPAGLRRLGRHHWLCLQLHRHLSAGHGLRPAGPGPEHPRPSQYPVCRVRKHNLCDRGQSPCLPHHPLHQQGDRRAYGGSGHPYHAGRKGSAIWATAQACTAHLRM